MILLKQMILDSRICKTCRVEKPIDKFDRSVRNKGGYKPSCSECSKIHLAKWRKSREDKYYVYYLPEEHYVGITNNVRERRNTHRTRGKIVEGLEILAIFERKVDAGWFEILLQQRGYYGFR